jgi:hypothetical protein
MRFLRFKKTIIAGIILCGIAFTSLIDVQLSRGRLGRAQDACVNNLRQIDGAKQTWALENHPSPNDIVTWQEIQPYLGRGPNGSLPVCPLGGTYILGRVGEPPKCSLGGTHSLN